MAQPSTQDFVKGFDPSGSSVLTFAALGQLIDLATPYTDKGLVVITTDIAGVPQVPDANTNTDWKRYLWIRQTATAINVYAWNANGASDATYLQWVPINIAGIGASSIVNSMIADNTIEDVKIAALSYSKLIGAPTALTTSSAATGDLLGSTYASLAVAPLAITTSKINDLAVTTVKINDKAVTSGKIAGDGSAKDMLRTATDTTAVEWFTPPTLFTSGVVVPTANSLKIPQVNPGATDFQMVASTTLGVVKQIKLSTSATVVAASGVLANTTSTPNYNATGMTAGFNSEAFTALDTTGTFKLLIEVEVQIASDQVAFVGLYNATGATAPLAGIGFKGSSATLRTVRFSYLSGVAPANATYYVAFGAPSSSGNTQINSSDGTNNPYLITTSSIKITEFIP